MDRRRFLRLTAAGGAAALVLPGWLARAFAQEPPRPGAPTPTDSLATLVTAFRDAQRLGKPLLVLVIPGPTESYARARAFGELLNHGRDEVMLHLSLAHVVCATADEVRTLAPQAPRGEPWMFLIETDSVPARVQPLSPNLTAAQLEATDDAAVDARLEALTSLLRGALLDGPPSVEERARLLRAHLDAHTRAALDTATRGGTLDPATADRAAPLVITSPALGVRFREALIQGTTARLRLSRVPGSVWATSSGCGLDIEGGEPSMVDCGMGHVPPRSARFLHFYVRQ